MKLFNVKTGPTDQVAIGGEPVFANSFLTLAETEAAAKINYKTALNKSSFPSTGVVQDVTPLPSNVLTTVTVDTDQVVIFLGDQIVFEWDDASNLTVPQELTWADKLNEIFEAGLRTGEKIANRNGR